MKDYSRNNVVDYNRSAYDDDYASTVVTQAPMSSSPSYDFSAGVDLTGLELQVELPSGAMSTDIPPPFVGSVQPSPKLTGTYLPADQTSFLWNSPGTLSVSDKFAYNISMDGPIYLSRLNKADDGSSQLNYLSLGSQSREIAGRVVTGPPLVSKTGDSFLIKSSYDSEPARFLEAEVPVAVASRLNTLIKEQSTSALGVYRPIVAEKARDYFINLKGEGRWPVSDFDETTQKRLSEGKEYYLQRNEINNNVRVIQATSGKSIAPSPDVYVLALDAFDPTQVVAVPTARAPESKSYWGSPEMWQTLATVGLSLYSLDRSEKLQKDIMGIQQDMLQSQIDAEEARDARGDALVDRQLEIMAEQEAGGGGGESTSWAPKRVWV